MSAAISPSRNRGQQVGAYLAGYGIDSEAIGLEVVNQLRRLYVPSSQPLFEYMLGRRSKSELVREFSHAPDCFDEHQLGAAFASREAQMRAVVFNTKCLDPVVPAAILRPHDDHWVAEAAVFPGKQLRAVAGFRFRSASMAQMLDLAREAFAGVLDEPSKAQSRLDYLRQAGDMFIPIRPDKRKWTIVSHWSGWQVKRLEFAERADRLAAIERSRPLSPDALRQICFRMGLTKCDNTDS